MTFPARPRSSDAAHLLCHGELVVVETEDDIYLGTAEVGDGVLIIRSGFVGRPVVIPITDVERISPANEHPQVLDPADHL